MYSRGHKFFCGCCLLIAVKGFAAIGYARQEAQAPADAKEQLVAGTNSAKEEPVGPVQEKSARDGQAEYEFSETTLGLSLLKNIALDQKAMWTSPFHMSLEDANWLVPFAGIAAASLASDTGVSRALTRSASTVRRSNSFSNYGVGAMGAISGGMFVLGKMTHDDHRTETGLLAGEAAVDAVAMTTALQYAFGRQRPGDGNGGGSFWQHGTSFPSDHSTASWAVASVIAHEYPGTFTKLLVYGLASAVSVSRLTGKDHFPTDVLVGGAIGWFSGRQVFRAHHDPDLGGGPWGSPVDDEDSDSRKRGLPDKSAASPFVPLDSWVYPAFERLAAMGLATTSLQGLKPWTRIECARLTEEVGDALVEATHNEDHPDDQAVQLHEALKREFAHETMVLDGARNLSFSVDSIYTRVTSISGPVLTDSYDLGGQTISYDFGRPFRRGTNEIVGTSFSGSEGPLAFFARVEYQHSPSAPPLPDKALQFISYTDGSPLQASHSFAPVDRADLLEGYVTFNHSGWQVSAGKQALSWSVGGEGSMLLSDNAEPMYMARLTRVIPMELPGFLHFVGPFRTEWFVGEVNGGPWAPHPLMYGQKFSFNVAHFLEVGYGRTAILGRGRDAVGGDAFTTYNYLHSFFGLNTSIPGANLGVPGFENNELDLNLDVPGLHHSASLYADLYERVVAVYIADPPLGAYRAGMYIPRLPHASRMDLRLEAESTESPIYNSPFGGHINYYDSSYRDGYTNFGELMGNTVGRMGRVFQGSSTFHLSALDDIQFTFRDHQEDPHYIPGGALWRDYQLNHEIHFRAGFYAKTMVQFEQIQHFPVLFSGRVNNVAASVELGFSPVWAKQ